MKCNTSGREMENSRPRSGFTQNFLHTQAGKTLIYILRSFEDPLLKNRDLATKFTNRSEIDCYLATDFRSVTD